MRPPRPARPALRLFGAHLPCALVILIAGSLFRPTPARAADDWFGRDKGLHFAASAGLALGGYGGAALFTADRPARLATGGGLALAAGIAKEISDRYTGGDPSWRDLGWDVVGTATGLTLAYLIDWSIRRWW
jgi:putative lipoprotein